MGSYFGKEINFNMKKIFLISFLLTLFLVFIPNKVAFAGNPIISCTLYEREAPIGGVINGVCEAETDYSFFQCMLGASVDSFALNFRVGTTGPIKFATNHTCGDGSRIFHHKEH